MCVVTWPEKGRCISQPVFVPLTAISRKRLNGDNGWKRERERESGKELKSTEKET